MNCVVSKDWAGIFPKDIKDFMAEDVALLKPMAAGLTFIFENGDRMTCCFCNFGTNLNLN